MAANVLTTIMFALQVILMCCLCIAGTPAFISYESFSLNQAAPLVDSTLLLKFESHAHSRFRRQSSSDGGVNADTATNSRADGQTLPDESSQPVTPYSNIDARNSSTSPAASATPVVSKDSTTVPTDKKNEGVSTTSDTDPFNDADIIHNNYNYYTSVVLSKKFSEHWVELENAPRHEVLSSGHRVAAVFNLKFDFYFYGHKVTNVTVATGGFLYMSPFLHKWLTATQYIAPLMANFDPSFSSNSSIYIQNEETRFIVEWKDVVLKDQNTTGRFHFQAILNQDGSIKFIYKSIPFPVANFSSEEHPVKVGLSDAYYNDTFIPESNIKRRTIYEYHKVVLPMSSVTTEKVIILTPLLTCNRLTECDICVKHTGVNFDCRWCSSLGRCSDGLDWYRQHWDKQGCQNSSVDICEMPTTDRPVTSFPPTSDKYPLTEVISHVSTNPSGAGDSYPSSRNPSTVLNEGGSSSRNPSTVLNEGGSSSRNPSTVLNEGDSKALMTECGNTNKSAVCTSLMPPKRPVPDSLSPSSENECSRSNDTKDCPSFSNLSVSIIDPASSSLFNDYCPDGKCNKKSEFPVAVVVIVILIICGLLAGLAGWVYYAYTHPTTRSGMWLMEHRPSQMKSKIKFWKSNSDAGTKYKVESEA